MIYQLNFKHMKILFFNTLILAVPFLMLLSTDDAQQIQLGAMRCHYEIMQDSIELELEAPTIGWLAIGFNSENNIIGSDLLQFSIREGQVVYEDQYVQAMQVHPADLSQGGQSNVHILGGEEQSGRTRIRFRIPMHSGDALDFKHTRGREFWMIMAYSQSDDFDHHSTMRKHLKMKWQVALQP